MERDERSAGGAGARKRHPTYLLQAIVCAVIFNPLAGVVAIVYGVKVNRKQTVGDWDGAARASRLARSWCWVSFAVGVVFLVLVLSGNVR